MSHGRFSVEAGLSTPNRKYNSPIPDVGLLEVEAGPSHKRKSPIRDAGSSKIEAGSSAPKDMVAQIGEVEPEKPREVL